MIYIAHGDYIDDAGRIHHYCGLGVESYSPERAKRRIELVLGGTVRGVREASAWPVGDAFVNDPQLIAAAEILRGYDAWERPGMGTFRLELGS